MSSTAYSRAVAKQSPSDHVSDCQLVGLSCIKQFVAAAKKAICSTTADTNTCSMTHLAFGLLNVGRNSLLDRNLVPPH